MLLRKIIRLLEDFDSFCRSIEPWDIETINLTWHVCAIVLVDVGCILYWYQLNRSQDSTAPWCATYIRQISDVHLTGKWRPYVTSSRCKSPWKALRRFSTEVLKNPAWKPKGLGFHGHHMMSVTNAEHRKICHWITRDHMNASAAFAFSFFQKITCDGPWTCLFAPQVRLAITVGEPSQRLVGVTYMPAYTP